MIMVQRNGRPADGASAKFVPGELVRHCRYGYRGVIADYDASCQAPDDWYQTNQTQPRRDQPWYHVLVDHSATTTYAAEENLEQDPDSDEIVHPLIALYFLAFEDGHYVRNHRPWGTV
jgi:heat shock protein HspQ